MIDVYIDVLFFVNFIINFIMLLTVTKLAGTYVKCVRLAFGAALGALYSVIMFFPVMDFLPQIPLKFVFALTIVAVSFGIRSIQRLLKYTLLFYIVSFAFAGAFVAFNYMTKGMSGAFDIRNGVPYLDVSVKALLITSISCYAVLGLLFSKSGKSFAGGRKTVKIKITAFSKSKEFTALVDTGNDLTDPITGKRILVAEFDTVSEIMPDKVKTIISETRDKNPVKILEELADMGYIKKFRLIPYSSLGKDFGMLVTINPEKVIIEGEKKDDILVGISNTKLSSNGAYTALLGI